MSNPTYQTNSPATMPPGLEVDSEDNGGATRQVVAIRNPQDGTAVVTDGSGVTQPISVASLPLPTGAATSAKQDDLLAELQKKADLTETQPVSLANLEKENAEAVGANDVGLPLMGRYNNGEGFEYRSLMTDGSGSVKVDFANVSAGTIPIYGNVIPLDGNGSVPTGKASGEAETVGDGGVPMLANYDTGEGDQYINPRADSSGGVWVDMRAYRASDGTFQHLRLDKATDSLPTMDYAHHEIHEGDHYFYTDYDGDVDTAGPKYYRLTTPNTTKWIHLNLNLYSEGVGTWQLFENPTVNAAGTTATTFNNNRNSGNTAGLVVAYDATSTADGTLLKTWRTGSGTTVPTRVGSSSSRDEEIILKQAEDYFIKFTPDADNAKTKLELEWYEHTNVA